MKYILRKAVLNIVPEIEINKEKYLEYRNARKVLSNCLAIEEKYEILISNYLEFERQILDATTSYMVRAHLDYSDFFDVRLGLNIRLVNFLTSARLYIDQLNQHVRECVPDLQDAKELVKALFSKEYDEHPEYRFMEALRNYVQHRGIPVHQTLQSGKWTSLGDDGLLEYSMDPTSQRSILAEDVQFKKSVLEELNEEIDLKASTRCYVESISNVHDAARQIIAQAVTAARNLLEDAHKQYAVIYSESLVGLSACIWAEGKQIESISLLLNWDDIRIKLQKRNRKATNLRKRYVTGKLKIYNN
jgi:predicted RNA binding protein with dsRBD fold (UPF0201 family)